MAINHRGAASGDTRRREGDGVFIKRVNEPFTITDKVTRWAFFWKHLLAHSHTNNTVCLSKGLLHECENFGAGSFQALVFSRQLPSPASASVFPTALATTKLHLDSDIGAEEQ